jgi:hypothetical protein
VSRVDLLSQDWGSRIIYLSNTFGCDASAEPAPRLLLCCKRSMLAFILNGGVVAFEDCEVWAVA